MSRSPDPSTAPPAPPAGGWWKELNGYHWWVLLVASMGWLFDSMDQRLFVLARGPALRQLLPGASEAELTQYGGYATTIFILGWATGGLIFGLFGDRWGRTRTMMITILLYSLFTGLSAVSHTWWDFALYRFLCGMGIGGEYAAGVSLVAETVPARARPYCLGLLQCLGAIGNVLGSAISFEIGPQTQVLGFAGWRVLFLIGIVPSLLVVIIRLRLREPESWLQARERSRSAAKSSAPPGGAVPEDELHKQLGDLREIARDARLRKHLILGMLLGLVGQVGIWGIVTWNPELIRGVRHAERVVMRDQGLPRPGEPPGIALPLSMEQLAAAMTANPAEAKTMVQDWKKSDDQVVALATMLYDLVGMVGIFIFSWLTTRMGRRLSFMLAFLSALGATWLAFGFLHSTSQVYWMIPILGFCISSVFGVYVVYFPELFPTRLRSTGIGFCYNVARYLTALAPLTIGKLTQIFLNYPMPIRPAAITISLIFLVGVAIARFAPETRGQPLPE